MDAGLDPAGPFFRDESGQQRLDAGDAEFVATLHSNMASVVLRGFGSPLRSGAVDVYLNGGEEQPGCQKLDLAGEVVASGLSPASLVRPLRFPGASATSMQSLHLKNFQKCI